ncbi:PspC domain-containing protein [Piscinibacter sakaiensis]|uniref:PspC domain-containing protein n=1 Tax=Piscinibacter sakaiensis TaxID=1547922 RepID=UPI003AAA47B1
MTDSEELARLGELHQRGVLSDDEFARAKARVLQGRASSPSPAPIVATINSLRRSRDDRWLGGVCGGLSQLSGLESWAIRLLFVLLLLVGGTGGFLYLLLWVLVPQEEPAPGPALSQR